MIPLKQLLQSTRMNLPGPSVQFCYENGPYLDVESEINDAVGKLSPIGHYSEDIMPVSKKKTLLKTLDAVTNPKESFCHSCCV